MIILLLIINNSCSHSNKNCKPDFFKDYNNSNDSISINIFKAKEIRFGSKCCFKVEFTYWIGFKIDSQYVPFFSYEGILYEINNSLFLLLNGEKEAIKFFDFRMKVGEKESINLKYNGKGYDGKPTRIIKSYTLKLEEKFYDVLRKDTIYKFRFIKWNSQNNLDDLIIFVGKDYGITGMYNSKTTNAKEEIYTYRGEIYKSRIKNSEVIFNSNIK